MRGPRASACRSRRAARAARARPPRGACAPPAARARAGTSAHSACRPSGVRGTTASASGARHEREQQRVAHERQIGRDHEHALAARRGQRADDAAQRAGGTGRIGDATPGSVARRIAADEPDLFEEPRQRAAPAGSPARRSRERDARLVAARAACRAARQQRRRDGREPRLARRGHALRSPGPVACEEARRRAPGRRRSAPAASTRRLGGEDQEAARERHRAQRARALRAGAAREDLARRGARARRARSAGGRAPSRGARRASRARAAGTSSRCPVSLRSAGRTNCSNVTIAETGFPGRPNTSGPSPLAKRPKHEREARLDLHAPEHAACSRASRAPGARSRDRRPRRRPSSRARRRAGRRGSGARDPRDRRARCRGRSARRRSRGTAPRASRSSTRRSGRPRRRRRARRARRRPRGSRRAGAGAPRRRLRPSAASMPISAGPSSAPGSSTRSPLRTSSPRSRTLLARAPARRARGSARRSRAHVLLTHDAVGARRKRRAGEDARRLPRAEPLRRARSRGHLERDAQTQRRSAEAPARSAARTA